MSDAQSKLKASTTELILIKALLDEHISLLEQDRDGTTTLVLKDVLRERMLASMLATRVDALLERNTEDEDE